jgi:hypothetical protein
MSITPCLIVVAEEMMLFLFLINICMQFLPPVEPSQNCVCSSVILIIGLFNLSSLVGIFVRLSLCFTLHVLGLVLFCYVHFV